MKTPQGTRKITTQVLAAVTAFLMMATFAALPDQVYAKKNRGQNNSNGHAQVSAKGGHSDTGNEGGNGTGKSGKKGESQPTASSSMKGHETSTAASSSESNSGKEGKGHSSSGKSEKGNKGKGSSGKSDRSDNVASSSSTSGSKGSGGHDGNASGGRLQGGKGKGFFGGSSGHPDVASGTTSEDDDSDRPVWAGKDGNHDLKPGGGNNGTDRKKGEDYGDLFVMSRADDGTLLMYDASGGTCDEGEDCYPAAIIVVDGVEELFVLAPDVDPPNTVQDVELGRLNISRSPDKVLEHALNEALSKLDGTTITAENLEAYTDLSGRLLTTDGVTAIDSPLENLSLYQAILEAYVDELTDITIHSGSYSLTLEADVIPQVAASALAAASDKHGTIEIDEVAYLSKFLEVEESLNLMVEDYDDWYNPDDFYDVDMNVLDVSGTTPVWNEVNLLDDDLDLFNDIPDINDDTNGIDVFAQAVDDSVQVLEFAHDNVTQVISY